MFCKFILAYFCIKINEFSSFSEKNANACKIVQKALLKQHNFSTILILNLNIYCAKISSVIKLYCAGWFVFAPLLCLLGKKE